MTSFASFALAVPVVLAGASLLACSSTSSPGSSTSSPDSSTSPEGGGACAPIAADTHDMACLAYMQTSCASQLAACQEDCASAAFVTQCLSSSRFGTTECLSGSPTKAGNALFECVDFPDHTCNNPVDGGAPPSEDAGSDG